ncbi:MAG: tRNA (adenine(22)-N(1))-methyltransferase [Mycoplasmatales bacterium]
MLLDKRLKAVKKLIKSKSVIDIGTDHAYLLIDFCKQSLEHQGLAVEVTEGPLNNAQKSILSFGLKDQIKAVKSDGLINVDEEFIQQYQTIIIAGMGGNTISNIMKSQLSKFKNKQILLQANNGLYELREFLQANNFQIMTEKVVKERKKYYEIIECQFVSKQFTLSKAELMFGPRLLTEQSNEFIQMWTAEYNHLTKINNQLPIKNDKLTEKIALIKENVQMEEHEIIWIN